MEIQHQLPNQNERLFTDFISRQNLANSHQFTFDIDSFRSQSPSAAQDVIYNPAKYYRLIKGYLSKGFGTQPKKYDAKIQHYNIKFEGNLGTNFVTPRGLNSRLANQLVGIQGIITKMQISKSQLEKSVHWCQKSKGFQFKQYPDNFNPQKQFQLKNTRFIKTYSDNNDPLQFQYGLSSFRNIQQVVIQELPQMAPPGLLPMSVPVILQNDLVNSQKPGDRVQMIGIYKLISGMQSKQKGIFRPYFICFSVTPLQQVMAIYKQPSKIDFPEDQVYGLLSRSIAPSVWGHQYMKKAVLLMLLGGVQKVLQNGTHLRGDINVLMVGDPGTAKSQILRWVLSSVDISVGTTGSGASGVGLTAAIVTDRQTGQKTLQAGAMVLADRGVVCIDQFDKMNQNDRVAVHEVMEQQTVTIAKAGLHCSLNARCSVLAAANPIYGQYQSNLPPTKNIGMPDSLLSRFDLIFVVLDEKNAQRDKKIAQKVCRNHRLAPSKNQFLNQAHQEDDYVINPIEHTKQEDIIYQKSNVYKTDSRTQILTQTFLKRYINYCKTNIFPVLTDNAINLASQLWSILRQKDRSKSDNRNQANVLPITIRSYQSLIRLATAHAKLRRSHQVQVKDMAQSFKLMVYCLYREQDALNSQFNQVLKQLGLQQKQFQGEFKSEKKNTKVSSRQSTKKQSKKIEEELKQQLSKIDLNKGQKQVQGFLKKMAKDEKTKPQQIKVEVTKEEISLVYRRLTQLKNKKRGERIQIQQIVKASNLPKSKIQVILQKLTDKLMYDDKKNQIYLY